LECGCEPLVLGLLGLEFVEDRETVLAIEPRRRHDRPETDPSMRIVRSLAEEVDLVGKLMSGIADHLNRSSTRPMVPT
jgi:hypothetical protein